MRRRRDKNEFGFNVWRSYSDMMAGILLLFVLIMCVTLFQSQINYENSIRERDEKLEMQEEYTQEIMTQKDIVANQEEQLSSQQDQLASQDELLASQDELLASQKKQLDDLAKQLEEQQKKLDEQSATLSSQQTALDEKTDQLAKQQEQIDKIIGVKAEVIEQLSKEFTNNNIGVQIDEDTGSMVLDSNVLFDYDNTELSDDGMEVLQAALPIYCQVLLQDEYFPYIAEIQIDGYTDSSGGYEYNLELSQQRSLAVAECLLEIAEKNLSAENQEHLKELLTVNGHSSSNLIYDENGKEDSEKSRRVEVKFRVKDEEMIQQLREILG